MLCTCSECRLTPHPRQKGHMVQAQKWRLHEQKELKLSVKHSTRVKSMNSATQHSVSSRSAPATQVNLLSNGKPGRVKNHTQMEEDYPFYYNNPMDLYLYDEWSPPHSPGFDPHRSLNTSAMRSSPSLLGLIVPALDNLNDIPMVVRLLLSF